VEIADQARAYLNDPGVVSSSPVSSHVFRPERIIGQRRRAGPQILAALTL
jgi:hypothetical protein